MALKHSPPPALRNLTERVGKTPMLRLTPRDATSAEVWCKCEQYNPGGSVKDRIAVAMIDAAERAGLIEPGISTLVEPTSGNTGIGLALVAAARGYALVLTMPESMSLERRQLLGSYGAQLVLTPAEHGMQGAVEAAHRIRAENSHAIILDQFRNPANPAAHREHTGPEIIAQMASVGPIDVFVAGVGTGGTISGVGAALRSAVPGVQIIAIEPSASRVLSGRPPGPHKIQGIGANFVPGNFDRSVVTDIRAVDDRAAYETARQLARSEGLLVGISSGANVYVARQVAAALGPGKRVVTVLCDTGERYFSTEGLFA